MHHEKVRGNYALYFTHWDRWMGTEFADYQERLTAVNNRPKGQAFDAMVWAANTSRLQRPGSGQDLTLAA